MARTLTKDTQQSGLWICLEFGEYGDTLKSMTQSTPPKIQLINTPEYRENYANSVQVRVNLWDFFLMFGRVNQTSSENVAIHNFQGIYVSPQQAKALLNVLQQNVSQYESAFGEIKLEPQAGVGIVQ
jgi:flagellar protein FlaG